METKFFRYPKIVKSTKNMCNFFAILPIFLFVFILLNNNPANFKSLGKYLVAMLSPFFMSFACILYTGSWSDIGINKDGLIVEFLWMSLLVPWKDVVEVKRVGSKMFGVILITTNNSLTLVHRIYSLFSAFTILPGFHIHPEFISPEVLKAINKYIAKDLL